MLRRLVGAFDRAAAIVAGALVVALLADVSLGAITRYELNDTSVRCTIDMPLNRRSMPA